MIGIPEKDINQARENNLCLVIRTKERRGAKWEFINEMEGDLEKALENATAIDVFEAGVLVKSGNGESIYWTSKNPHLFNSPVLFHDDVIWRKPT